MQPCALCIRIIEFLSQGESDGKLRVDRIACRRPYADAPCGQYMIVKRAVPVDRAAVVKQKAVGTAFGQHGKGVLDARRIAAVAAQKRLLVAAHRLCAADVEPLRARCRGGIRERTAPCGGCPRL